ncbi:MAG: DUF1902 domain-containing protein [Defluviitaleaceae bacterium]|nr:DUF1902 domain-containing protein [Defluviitaleaceae bacterium]
MNCTIICTFDDESQRWTAVSDDKYGLVLESNSLEALMERVKIAMPDMLEFTCNYIGPVNLLFKAERLTQLAAAI